MLKVTTLIDNTVRSNCLCSEHGLSLLIDNNNQKILFDTGSSGQFVDNVNKMNIDLNNLDFLILSHAHDDHTGGFERLITQYKVNCPIVVGEDFLNNKYKFVDGTYIYDGNPFPYQLLTENRVRRISDSIEMLDKDIYVLSRFTSRNDFEFTSKQSFIKTTNGYIQDTFSDEVVLIINTISGLVVFVGCSHVGIVNILETIKEKFQKPIYGVIGGIHLFRSNEDRVNRTIEYFSKEKIHLLSFCHCTGELALNKFNKLNNFVLNYTGKEILID